MAANANANSSSSINLRPFGMEDESERGDRFWNKNVVEMKFSTEKDWMKLVRFCEGKPNYGMQNLDPVLEEITGNKLELVGPLMDGYLKEVGIAMSAKLSRSRMTGLMSPVVLFIPYAIFRHLWVLGSGYGGDVEVIKKGEQIKLLVSKAETAAKLWSPARFSGQNYLTKRHFDKVPENGRIIQHYAGKSRVVVTEKTPLILTYSMKQQRVTTTFYVQRYDGNDFVRDANLQKLMIQDQGQ